MTASRSAVLFLVFNRPDTTARVFEKIREARPPRLYIAADGPRPTKPSETELCQKAREAAGPVDWPCKVETLFHENNLGCKEAVSSALDWFFRHEEEGVILEDDCLPAKEFFWFCDTLLERYRTDIRVRHIGGSNLQFGHKHGNASYYFSRLTHVWGWASWRRAWQDYDKNLAAFTAEEINKTLKRLFDEPIAIEQWQQIAADLKQNKIDTWDYQLALTNFIHDGLSIIPNENLITNIGFGPSATHTLDGAARFAHIPLGTLSAITHPKQFIPEKQADAFTLNEQFNIEQTLLQREQQARKYSRLKYRIKRWLAAHGGPERWRNVGT